MMPFFFNYRASQGGATAIEYALIASGISLAIVAAVFTFGDGLTSVYDAMLPAMTNVNAEIVLDN